MVRRPQAPLMEEDLAGEEMTGVGHGRGRGWGEAGRGRINGLFLN